MSHTTKTPQFTKSQSYWLVRLLIGLVIVGTLLGLGILYLTMFWNRGYGLWGIPRFLSYFTVLSNLLALIVAVLILQEKISGLKTLGGSALAYLLITFLIYHGLLRGVWAPVGWELVGDIFLHYLNPLFFLCLRIVLIYFYQGSDMDSVTFSASTSIFTPTPTPTFKKPRLQLGKFDFILRVLGFPAMYFIVSLIIGEFTGRYPYPFLNVTNLGYPGVFVNALFIALGFILVATVVMMLDWVVRWVRWTRNRIVT